MQVTTLITGANRGIGLELVRQCARAGWRVLACCRNPQNAAELKALAKDADGDIGVHRLDVTDPDQRAALVGALAGMPIDMLINNAGVYGQQSATFGNTDEQRWLETFAINTIAPMKLSEALVENVAKSDRKIIAGISSMMGSIADNGSGGHYVYRSSKAALNAVMKSMAIDLKARGIKTVILHPGWVKTDMGGPNAQITVEQSVRGMLGILERATPNDSGKFFDVKGGTIPW
jgi:NAD(P)-dependent dehydrogenase (short-subunit alcohol dehydrogenase family)